MQFRQDVAGLRAVAVVPIVLLHAGVSALPGGFVGVDIFFVISGFLITAILTREMDGRSYSLLEFYRRRAVRILPALLVVLAATLIAGCLLLFPADLRELGNSAAATAAFGSNILFWRTASYFESVPELRPLLHTWSLGVEEQFYIFWPLLLIALRRFLPGRLRLALVAIAFLSFALSLMLALRNPMAAFYLLPSRAWELSLGGLVALGAFPALSPRMRSLLSLLGLALVAAGMFVINDKSLFPAPWGLLPCLGTALLIAYGEHAPTARLLTLAPMRGIGAISYSLYLWHWPILSFWRFQNGVALTLGETVATIALSLVAATLSYLLIEQPFLRRFRHGRPAHIVVAGLAAIAVTVGASLLIAANAPRISRLDPAVARIVSYANYPDTAEYRAQFRPGTCFSTIGAEHFDEAKCLTFDAKRPNVLLVGDSLAAHLWRALAERHPEANVMQASASGCFPFLGGTGDAHCVTLMEHALGPLLDTRRPDRILLNAFWYKRKDDLGPLFATIRAIRARGIPVTVIGPVPEYRDGMPRLLGRAEAAHDRAIVDEAEDAGARALDLRLAGEVRAAGGDYVSVYAAQCPNGRCRLIAPDGGPMVFDQHHWTQSAARAVIANQPVF